MDSQNINEARKLDLIKIFKTLRKQYKYYLYVLPVVWAVSLVIIMSLPRYYRCDVLIAPEASDGSGISSFMSAFGFGDGGANSEDAIAPSLYPDLMKSKEFQTSLFSIKVTTLDKSISTTYYDYLSNHRKETWLTKSIKGIKNLFIDDQMGKDDDLKHVSPFMLTKSQDRITKIIEGNIECKYDKRYSIISLSVTDDDPLVSALIADTICQRLQYFITDYRTKKAKSDYAYTVKMQKEISKEYNEAYEKYVNAVDQSWDIVDETTKAQQKKLENDMNLKYQSYHTINQKMQAAKLKVQENTPVITMLQVPTVPLKPAGPKRMISMLVITIIAIIATSIFIMVKDQQKPLMTDN